MSSTQNTAQRFSDFHFYIPLKGLISHESACSNRWEWVFNHSTLERGPKPLLTSPAHICLVQYYPKFPAICSIQTASKIVFWKRPYIVKLCIITTKLKKNQIIWHLTCIAHILGYEFECHMGRDSMPAFVCVVRTMPEMKVQCEESICLSVYVLSAKRMVGFRIILILMFYIKRCEMNSILVCIVQTKFILYMQFK